MKKLMKNKPLIALIASILIIVVVMLLPKLTGRTLGELLGDIFGAAQEQTSETGESAAETSKTPAETSKTPTETSETAAAIDEKGTYTSKEDVALYIRTYGKLPQNFITKSQARSLGWEGGPLWGYAPGKSIGGDVFTNSEGLLPKKSGRKWYECDIDYDGGKRNAKRIVFSNDGLIYYTDDHYATFTELK